MIPPLWLPAAASAEEDGPTLDELFKKTKSKPPIYFLPLSAAEVALKLAKASTDARGGPGSADPAIVAAGGGK